MSATSSRGYSSASSRAAAAGATLRMSQRSMDSSRARSSASLTAGEVAIPLAPGAAEVARTAWGQQALSGHVVDLQANPIGILEQHRIIAGRPFVILGRVDDRRADRDGEGVRLILSLIH